MVVFALLGARPILPYWVQTHAGETYGPCRNTIRRGTSQSLNGCHGKMIFVFLKTEEADKRQKAELKRSQLQKVVTPKGHKPKVSEEN